MSPNAEWNIAHVLPLLEIAHLDRLFDYRIPDDQLGKIQPGMLVRVRFHGRLVNAIVWEISNTAEYQGKIAVIDRLISPIIYLNAQFRELVTKLARRYAGTKPDIIRHLVPSRQVRVEKSFFQDSSEPERLTSPIEYTPTWEGDLVPGMRYSWLLPSTTDWITNLANLAFHYVNQEQSVIILFPTLHQARQFYRHCRTVLPEPLVSLLGSTESNEKGPGARYKDWLHVYHGSTRLIIGMRSAVYAPAVNLGVIIIFDDGDELYAEPLAPYPHSRVVALQRNLIEHCAVVCVGYSLSVEAYALLQSGWLQALGQRGGSRLPRRANRALNHHDPIMSAARIPSSVFTAISESLKAGSAVLVHVQHTSQATSIYCIACRRGLRCRHCHGPVTGGEAMNCRWCSRSAKPVSCLTCGGKEFATHRSSAERTAKELGRAFPSYRLVESFGNSIERTVKPGAALVVATTHAEPTLQGGYQLGVYLDALRSIERPDLRASENTYRCFCNFMSHLSPEAPAIIVDDAAHPFVIELLRQDPLHFAQGEYASRAEVRFPPAVRVAAIDGTARSISQIQDLLGTSELLEFLGPVPLPSTAPHLPGRSATMNFTEELRLLVRTPIRHGSQLSELLWEANRRYSMHKNEDPVRICVDPVRLG